jgi:hypothetical protein
MDDMIVCWSWCALLPRPSDRRNPNLICVWLRHANILFSINDKVHWNVNCFYHIFSTYYVGFECLMWMLSLNLYYIHCITHHVLHVLAIHISNLDFFYYDIYIFTLSWLFYLPPHFCMNKFNLYVFLLIFFIYRLLKNGFSIVLDRILYYCASSTNGKTDKT